MEADEKLRLTFLRPLSMLSHLCLKGAEGLPSPELSLGYICNLSVLLFYVSFVCFSNLSVNENWS